MVYLASPYSDPCPAVRVKRYEQAMDAAWRLAQDGVAVYSPIVHWHNPGLRHGAPHDFNFWKVQDEGMIEAAHELWALMIPGWRESHGMRAEVTLAARQGKPIWYLDPETLTVTKEPPLAA